MRTSAETRSGKVAADRIAIGRPPSWPGGAARRRQAWRQLAGAGRPTFRAHPLAVAEESVEPEARGKPPALASAPGPTRTGDPQVRSLTTVLTQPISHHPSPVRNAMGGRSP